MELKGYRKRKVWGKADELAFEVCGYGRHNRKELRQFVNIALGSLAETEYLLDCSLKPKYFSEEVYNRLQNLREEVGKLLWGFYKSL